MTDLTAILVEDSGGTYYSLSCWHDEDGTFGVGCDFWEPEPEDFARALGLDSTDDLPEDWEETAAMDIYNEESVVIRAAVGELAEQLAVRPRFGASYAYDPVRGWKIA